PHKPNTRPPSKFASFHSPRALSPYRAAGTPLLLGSLGALACVTRVFPSVRTRLIVTSCRWLSLAVAAAAQTQRREFRIEGATGLWSALFSKSPRNRERPSAACAATRLGGRRARVWRWPIRRRPSAAAAANGRLRDWWRSWIWLTWRTRSADNAGI